MKYKAVIVDDEPVICSGMRSLIKWDQEHCTLAGESSNGVDGIKLIMSVKPDIIITDICMPQTQVNGLEMIRQIQSLLPDAKIIIHTGYRKLEYIEEALEMGAIAYLVKPTSIEKLLAALRKAVMQLDYKAGRSDKIEELKLHFTRSLPVLRQKLLYDIIFQIITNPTEVQAALAIYKIAIEAFVLVLCEVNNRDPHHKMEYNKQLDKISVANCFADILITEYTFDTVSLTQDQLLFLIGPRKPGLEFESDVYSKVEELQHLVETFAGFTFTAAVSTRGLGWQQLSEKTGECRAAIDYKFYMGEGALILCEDLVQKVPPGDMTLMDKAGRELVAAIRLGDEKRAGTLLFEINTFFNSNPRCNIKNVRHFYIQLTYEIDYLKLETNQRSVRDPAQLHRELSNSAAISDYQTILKNLVLELVRQANCLQKANISKIINRATKYIELNYPKDLSLSEVAENAYASTHYISRMFKPVTGKSFTDYLKEVRIRHARELLKNPQLKIYEVAEISGFSDHHYFSKVFKEVTAQTPTEYRNSIGIEETL